MFGHARAIVVSVIWILNCLLTLRRPLRKNFLIRWFFDVSKVKESSFFLNRTSLTLLQISDAHLFENTDFSPSRFHFSVGFITRSCFESDGLIAYSNVWDWREKRTIFIHINQRLITSFYIKRYFFAELAMSQRWSVILCATGAWGLNSEKVLNCHHKMYLNKIKSLFRRSARPVNAK